MGGGVLYPSFIFNQFSGEEKKISAFEYREEKVEAG